MHTQLILTPITDLTLSEANALDITRILHTVILMSVDFLKASMPQDKDNGSGGSKGGARDVRPPWGSKFFHFHVVFGRKIG